MKKILLAFYLCILNLSVFASDFVEDLSGTYTVKNRGLSVGFLTWAGQEAPSGHLAQVLAERGYYPDDREKYLPGGRYRDSILWDLIR